MKVISDTGFLNDILFITLETSVYKHFSCAQLLFPEVYSSNLKTVLWIQQQSPPVSSQFSSLPCAIPLYQCLKWAQNFMSGKMFMTLKNHYRGNKGVQWWAYLFFFFFFLKKSKDNNIFCVFHKNIVHKELGKRHELLDLCWYIYGLGNIMIQT